MKNPPDKCLICGESKLEIKEKDYIVFDCDQSYAEEVDTKQWTAHDECSHVYRIALESVPFRRMWERLKKILTEVSKEDEPYYKAFDNALDIMTDIEQEEGDGV